MAKKKRHDRRYEIAKQKIFLSKTTLSLSLSAPNETEDIVRSIKNTTLPNNHPYFESPIDRLLRPLEKEALGLIENKGYSTDIESIAQLESKHTRSVSRYYFKGTNEILFEDEVSPERLREGEYVGCAIMCDLDADVLNAIQVLRSGQNVRHMIANNQTEDVAFEMMRLTFAAVSANIGKDIMNAVNYQIGRVKGGSAPKRKLGIERAINKVREIKGTSAKAQEIWRYFKANHKGKGKAMNADGYDIYYDSVNDLLCQDDDYNCISSETFRKYVNPPKKIG